MPTSEGGIIRYNLDDPSDMAVLIRAGLIWRGGPDAYEKATEYLQAHPAEVNDKVPASVLAQLQPTEEPEQESPVEDTAEGGVEEPA